MGTSEKISVIIPVYNGERYLAEAIESALAQSRKPLEIIVVDDGSIDGTAKVAKSFGSVHYKHQKQGGAGAARNFGLDLAQGDYFAFLDADDIWLPEKLSLQFEAFCTEPRPDIVFGHVEQFISPELYMELKDKVWCPEQPMPGTVPSAMMAEREAFLRVGTFDTTLEIGEFTDWYLRAHEAHLRLAMIPEVVARRRIHEQNQGVRRKDQRPDYLAAIKASLDRRRKDS